MGSPTRRPPQVGHRAQVMFFGGETHQATIVEVSEGGRLVSVETEAGERLDFELNGATARFVLAGEAHGPRLEIAAQST